MPIILPRRRSVRGVRSRAVGLLAGVVADAVLGDPRRGHPVAAFGRVAAACERRWWADRRAAGLAHTAGLVAAAVGLGLAAERAGRGRPVRHAVLTAAATWVVLGGTSLARHGAALAAELDAAGLPAEGANGALAAARARIPALCGRDPASLDVADLARAGTESIAENTSDAVVAPLLWGAVAGVPGLVGYRAANTLDAMVGHRSARYARFGWAAARLDDAANLVPARVAALLFAGLAPVVGGSPAEAVRAWCRDAGAHPSPNAGPVEAAAAGALGVRLGGPTVYAHGVEDRPVLGTGRAPGPGDLRRAVRLSRWVGGAGAALACAVALRAAGDRADGPGRA
jgi:adenosylcobinamide-phosphate synthase